MTLYRCEQWRAGQICNRILFTQQREAEEFLQKMRRVEPDIFWRMEAVPAAAVWN